MTQSITEWLKEINNDYPTAEEIAENTKLEDDTNEWDTEESARFVDTSIKVGDEVRSYDFDYVDDCYVEGVVVGMDRKEGSERYVIKMTAKIFGGENETEKYFATTNNDTFYPPINGLQTWMGGLTCSVQKLNKENKK